MRTMTKSCYIQLLLILFIVPGWATPLHKEQPQVIFIYGTSCAGKSTLSKQLIKSLGNQWKLIDRDKVIEERQKNYLQHHSHLSKEQLRQAFDQIEAQADEAVLEEIRRATHNALHVIVDTQLHQNLLNQLSEARSFSVLVYAPLHVLLERDHQRNQRLNRSEKRQFYAKAFILETFAQLYSLDICQENAKLVDVLHPADWDESVLQYCVGEEIYAFFERLFCAKESVHLWSRESCDLVVNSQDRTIEEVAELLISASNKTHDQSLNVVRQHRPSARPPNRRESPLPPSNRHSIEH